MPELERILRGTPGTLSKQWYEDGVAVDPGTVTVGITRADGTTLVSAGTATTGSGSSPRAFALMTTHTALLDQLHVTWTSTAKGELTSVVEVVGGFVFTVAQARQISGLSRTDNSGNYVIPTAQIIEARTEVERMLEHELGYAMVPRYSLETISGDGGYSLGLRPYVRSVRSVTVDSTAWTGPEVALLAFNPSGFVYSSSRWSEGFANITVGYEHGMDVPPPNAAGVALKLARSLVVGSPADDRAASVSTDEQTTTFYVPGASEPFALPEANRFVQAHSLRVGLA